MRYGQAKEARKKYKHTGLLSPVTKCSYCDVKSIHLPHPGLSFRSENLSLSGGSFPSQDFLPGPKSVNVFSDKPFDGSRPCLNRAEGLSNHPTAHEACALQAEGFVSENLNQDKLEPIAVIGFSLRFPQDATSPAALWQMLVERRSAFTEFPKDRFNFDAFYHQDQNRKDTDIIFYLLRYHWFNVPLDHLSTKHNGVDECSRRPFFKGGCWCF